MSKRKHKSRKDTRRETVGNSINNDNINNANNRQTYNNGPFGINPNQLLSSMFGNIDMSQISSILQSMNTQGFDFNNLNLGNLQNLMGNMGNMGNIGGQGVEDIIKGENSNRNKNEKEDDSIFSNVIDDNIKNNNEKNDENIQMLRAIRSIVGDEKGKFIDKIITMYNNGKFD